jgi:hypothetical protein
MAEKMLVLEVPAHLALTYDPLYIMMLIKAREKIKISYKPPT